MAGITSGDLLKESPQKSKQGFAKLLLQGITFSHPFEENQHHMNDLSGISLSSPPLLKAGFQRINKGITFGDPHDGNLQKSKQWFASAIAEKKGLPSVIHLMGTYRSQSRNLPRVSPSVSIAVPRE